MYSDFEILKAFLLILHRSEFGKNGLPYNIPVRGQLTPINSCFDVLRKFLPEEFKDKSNKEILKYLRQDPRSAERLVATRFRLEEAQELMQALEEEPVATAEASGQPTPTGQEVPPVGTTGAPMGGLPSAPSISTPQIPIRMPKAPVPEPEISKLYVADAGGNVVEERSIKPTSVSARPAAQGPSQFHVTDERGNIVQTYSKEPTPVAPQTEAPQQPKLVIADRYGNIKEPQKPPGPQTLYTQDKSGIIREHQVKPPSRFSVFRSRLSSFASPLMNKIAGSAGPAIKKGLGGIGRGITGIGRDGLQAAAPALGRTFNRGLDGLDRLTRPRRPNFRRKPKLASKFTTGRKVALALALFFIVFVGILVIPPSGTVPTGQAAPINPNNNSGSNYGLDYTLPLKNSSVQPLDIKTIVKSAFPGAKLEYWDKIVQSSIYNGFNPALALALWIEETGASQTTLAKNGGSEIPVNGAFTRGHLGCAPTEDQTIDESLSCLFKFSAANNFTNDQFTNFMAKYSGGPVNTPFSNNPNFPKNIKDWYSRLVPSGTGAIVAVTISPTPQQTIASCPVAGGKISTSSYNASPATGHCGDYYSYTCKCGTSGRRAKAIDVPANGQNVILPKINNQDVSWKLIVGPYSVDSGEGGGLGYTFQATQGNDIYHLDMLHLNQSALVLERDYLSGTPVATTAISHVHMTMGKNLKQTPIAGTETDCDPNWLPSDFLCQ